MGEEGGQPILVGGHGGDVDALHRCIEVDAETVRGAQVVHGDVEVLHRAAGDVVVHRGAAADGEVRVEGHDVEHRTGQPTTAGERPRVPAHVLEPRQLVAQTVLDLGGHRTHQGPQRLVRAHTEPQGHDVRRHARRTAGRLRGSARHRQGDHQLVQVRDTVQVDREQRDHEHRPGDPLGARHGTQPVGLRCRDEDRAPGEGQQSPGRGGPAGAPDQAGERLRSARQVLPPGRPFDRGLLGGSVRGVLGVQLGEPTEGRVTPRLPGDRPLVQLDQPLQQHPHARAVDDQVVEGVDVEVPVVGQLDQHAADRAFAGQIEGRPDRRVHQLPGRARRIRRTAHIGVGERALSRVGVDQLPHLLAVVLEAAGAHDIGLHHEAAPSGGHQHRVDRAQDVPALRDGVLQAGGVQGVRRPDIALGLRERQPVGGRSGCDGGVGRHEVSCESRRERAGQCHTTAGAGRRAAVVPAVGPAVRRCGGSRTAGTAHPVRRRTGALTPRPSPPPPPAPRTAHGRPSARRPRWSGSRR